MLGPVEATANSIPLELGGPKQRALLALLLLRANEVVPRERLIDELWGEAPPTAARDTVKVYVGRLRKTLSQNGSPERLVTRGGGYLLRVEPDELDLRRFERLVDEGSRANADGDAKTAASILREALALWHGPPLVDLGEVPFARAEQARLEELRLAAIEERIDADLALGRASAVIPELQQLSREHPYRERLHRQLMLALYRTGRQAEALSAYQEARTTLVEQLGIEPSKDLRELERAILEHDPALEPPPITMQSREEPQVVTATDRRRRLLVVGAASIVVVGGAIGAVLHNRADATVKVHSNSVAVIDPGSNKLVDAVDVGREPAFVAVADGRVWAGNTQDDSVTEIDASSRTTIANIPVNDPPAGLVAGQKGVWVLTGAQNEGSKMALIRIDPSHPDGETAEVALGTTNGYPRQPLALSGSTIWAPGPSKRTLVRRDPTTLAPRGAVDVGGVASAIADSPDGVWATTWGNRLLRISPYTDRPIDQPAAIGRYPFDVAVGGNAVWIASWGEDAVFRYDGATPSSSRSIAVGRAPVAVAYGFGSVWVACAGDGTIWRIDPSTRRVLKQWALGASPGDIAAGEGAVWIAVYSKLAP